MRHLAWFENITDAADGLDQFVLEGIVDFCAQAAHNHVNHVRVGFESDVPHLFCNLSTRYHFARRTDEMSQQEKFFRCEIERKTGTRSLVPSHVDLQIIDAQTFYSSLRSASQYRTHPGEQFGKRKRLDEIIVRAQFQSFNTVAHTVAGGKKKNRRANPIAAEFRDHFPAVLVWQHDIDNKKINFGCARFL